MQIFKKVENTITAKKTMLSSNWHSISVRDARILTTGEERLATRETPMLLQEKLTWPSGSVLHVLGSSLHVMFMGKSMSLSNAAFAVRHRLSSAEEPPISVLLATMSLENGSTLMIGVPSGKA